MTSKIDVDKAVTFALGAQRMQPWIKLALIAIARHDGPITVPEISAQLGLGRGGNSRMVAAARELTRAGLVVHDKTLNAIALKPGHPAWSASAPKPAKPAKPVPKVKTKGEGPTDVIDTRKLGGKS